MQPNDKVNILLVDDKPENLLALEAILDSLDRNIVKAKSGAEALKCLLKQDFAVILLDVHMPVMNGFETAKLIRSRATSEYTPIIFITALNRDEEYVSQGYSLGAVDYLFKPIVPEILLAKVRTFISLFKATQVLKKQTLDLKAVNRELELEILKRQQAETALSTANEKLEIRVAERTAQLKDANEKLIAEIAERQEIEIALRKSESQYRTLVETIPYGIEEIDITGTITFSNPAQHKILGYEPGELLGKKIWELTTETEASHLQEYLAMLVQDHPPQTPYVGKNLTKQGNLIDIQVDWDYKLNDLGETTGFISIITDITERKEAEGIRLALSAEQELRKRQLRFFSLVSHEFRTPLGTILGSAQILESCTKEWPELKRLRNLHRIKSAAKHLTQLLDDILTINRAETGKLEFNPRPIDLDKFCHQLVEAMELTPDAKDSIKWLCHGENRTVNLDEKLLRYILTNLLSNAVKYSPQGQEVNFIKTYKPEGIALPCQEEKITPIAAVEEIVFQIQDKGIGIPPEDQNHIFELFHRGANVGEIPGTGLGLSVVKKCVELQGGEISFKSEVGVGTTVTVTIPVGSVLNL